MTADPIVALENVTFRYPDSDVLLQGLSLEVHRGERLAVVGPNGAGKSTLLKLLSGLLVPERGSVRVCGLDPARSRRSELARRVAVVGEQGAIGFPYTALEVVLMGRAPYVQGFRLESEADVEVARRAMAATGVAELESRCFDTLSSGERQRVAIARALAQEPELLLLDEPAAFLDIRQQAALCDLLADLNRRSGVTIISVLHDLNLVALYFDRVAMMAIGDGATAEGDCPEVVGRPGKRPRPRRLYAVGRPEEVLTYAAIREVFATDVYVTINDLTGKLNVLPLPKSSLA